MLRIILFLLLLAAHVILYSCNNDSEKENSAINPPKKVTANDSSDGVIYFSTDNGVTWENKSDGLPYDIVITDLSSSPDFLILSTKQHGIFLYEPEMNHWRKAFSDPATGADIDVISVFNNTIYAGTGGKGIFLSSDKGRTWMENNNGLENLTIRRLAFINDKFYACTNGGVYSFDYADDKWEYEFGNILQVNGMTESGGDIYAGTNKGIYKYNEDTNEWVIIKNDLSLHNIGSVGNSIYAMAYNELFYSSDKGKTWLSGQEGLPANLYTFQIKQKDTTTLAAQWDGIYILTAQGKWNWSAKGIPSKLAVTELTIFKNIIAAGAAKRKLSK